MDWLLPYYWAGALSASGIPMPSWGSVALPVPEPAPAAPIRALLTSSLSWSSTRYSWNGPTAASAARLSIQRSTSNSPVDPSPAAGLSWPRAAVDRGGTAKWQEWSNETVSFGSAGLRRTTGRGQADERQASDQSSKTCQQMALRRC